MLCITWVNGDSALFASDNKLWQVMESVRQMTFEYMGNNPMVGATVACAVAVEEAMKA